MFFCLHAPSTYNRRQKCLKYFAFPEFFSAAVAASFPPPSATKSILLCRTQSDLVENYKIEGGSWGRLEDRIKLIMQFKFGIWQCTMIEPSQQVLSPIVVLWSWVFWWLLYVSWSNFALSGWKIKQEMWDWRVSCGWFTQRQISICKNAIACNRQARHHLIFRRSYHATGIDCKQ